MTRLHIALRTDDLDASLAFYTTLFGTPPTVREPDYAKWLLDDPRVNFSVTARSGRAGIEHLGIQAEDESELHMLYARLADAERHDEGHTTCCYAQSEKTWVEDPQGIAWEVFHTYGASATFYDEAHADAANGAETACCAATCCAEPA